MKKYVLAAALAVFAFASGAAARALDIADVKSLVRNQVDEEVIVNMVLEGGALPATTGDVAELRALGASETLISAVEAVSRGTSSPGEYILQDGATASVPQPGTVYYEAPTVIETPPTVYYETPTYVYPYPYPYHHPRPHFYRSRPGFSITFGFGSGGRRYGRRHFRRW